MKVYAANPSELQILENPSPKKRKMATRKSTTTRRTPRRKNPSMATKITDIAGPAISVIAGQALATQITQLALGQLSKVPANIRKVVAVAIPTGLGVVLMMQKNKLLQSAGVGSASSGALFALKVAMPTLQTVPLAGDVAGFLADNTMEPEDQFLTDEAGNIYDQAGNYLYNVSELSDYEDDDLLYLDDTEESGYLNEGDFEDDFEFVDDFEDEFEEEYEEEFV